MASTEKEAMRIFGERAARYTTSAAHTDPQVLARVVELAAPSRMAGAGHRHRHGTHGLCPGTEAPDCGRNRPDDPDAYRRQAPPCTPGHLQRALWIGGRPSSALCDTDVSSGDLPPRRPSLLQNSGCHRGDAPRFTPGGRLVIDDRSVPRTTSWTPA